MRDSHEQGVEPAHSVLPVRFSGVGFAAGATMILQGIDLAVTSGGPTVLLGPNGSGKTTLLRLAMGLIEPSQGTIAFAGAVQARPGSRAIVFQKPVMLRRTTADNVAFARHSAGQPVDRDAVARLLALTDLSAVAERPARRLSGGEQQRLALARALAREPQLLLLDEPTASLDPAATKRVEDIIARVAASGVKVVMATHDLGQARRLAADVVFLGRGRLIEQSSAAAFFANPVSVEAQRFLAGDLVI
jgi:tungstate transport system ATP-binding protein